MALRVTSVTFDGWRNLGTRTLRLDGGVTVHVGPTAAGKTNTVEAL